MGDNIISFKIKKKEHDQKKCQHSSVLVDESHWLIECEDCGAIVDPIWWISSLAKRQSLVQYKLDQMNKNYAEVKQRLQTRVRTKCDHCGKMTSIKGLDK